MTRPGWHEQNPRLESAWQAHLREQADSRTRKCPVLRCEAPPGVECVNAQTGKPFRGGVSHLARVRKEGASDEQS